MDKIYKCIVYIVIILLVPLSILKAINICITHQLGYLEFALILIIICALWYGLYRLSFFIAERITTAYAEVYKNKVIPHIEMQAIDRYIAEHPLLPETKQEEGGEVIDGKNLNDTNQLKNAQMELEQFMAVCRIEREAMMAKKANEDAEKLKKVLEYTRQTFMKFGFTDEELFQLNECVTTFVTLRAVLPAINVHIVKKALTQGDLKNFSWNIANQYNIEPALTAQFTQSTFSAWFANTEVSSLMKNPKVTSGKVNIEVNVDILNSIAK